MDIQQPDDSKKYNFILISLFVVLSLVIVGIILFVLNFNSIMGWAGSRIDRNVSKLSHTIYLGVLEDPDKDKDGLEDSVAEKEIYKTDPKETNSKDNSLNDGQYIYSVYKKAFIDGNKEALSQLAKYKDNFETYKLTATPDFINRRNLKVGSLEEIFGFRSLETYNLYVGMSDSLKQVVRQSLDFRLNGKYNESLKLLQDAIIQNPDSAILKYHLGLTYHGMKEYQKALSVYESIANDSVVKSPLLYSDLASANYALNNKDKFVEYLELSIKTFPEDLSQYIKLSNYYDQEKQFDKAIEVLNMGLKIEPRYARFYNDLGVLYESKGNNEKSLEYQTKAISYDFRYAKGHFNLSILNDGYKNDLKTALFEARIALDLDPSYSRHIVRVATLYEKLNMKKEAGDVIKSFSFTDSDLDVLTLVDLGRLYVMRGDNVKAEKYYNEALIIDPQNYYAKSNMEALQSYQNTANSMINASLQAIKINPYDDQAYKTLIDWYINNKRYDDAKKVLDKAYSLGLKDWGFDSRLERLNGLMGD